MPAPVVRRRSTECVLIAVLLIIATALPLDAQYPVAPTAVINLRALAREPRFSGYLSMRETYRSDTSTFSINRARMAVQAAPTPFVGLRLQLDFAALGRTTGTSGDTIPAVQLADAFVQLGLPDSTSRLEQLLRPALLIGQFRTPFGLEAQTSFSTVITANRAMVSDRLAIRRERGVQLHVRLPRLLAAGVALVDGEGTSRTGNSDGRQLAIGRLSVLPLPSLSVSGKLAGQGDDHRWGYDARWSDGRLVLEGEYIARDSPLSTTMDIEAHGGYALLAYRLLPWLQPVVKWEQYHEELITATVGARSRATHTTYGVTFLAPQDRFRAQLNWIDRSEHPVGRKGELVAQFQAIY